jgi:uncharacterized protein (DUF433 family)
MLLTKREKELLARWIEPHPHKPDPAEAVLAQYSIPVWALIGRLEGAVGDIAEVAAAYGVPEEAVEAALAYYRKRPYPIEARLVANGAEHSLDTGRSGATATQHDRELIARWIDPDPSGGGPHEARLKKYGVSVWVMAAYWQDGTEDIDPVMHAYRLPREAAEAALAYYRQHRYSIDARIALNDAAFDG